MLCPPATFVASVRFSGQGRPTVVAILFVHILICILLLIVVFDFFLVDLWQKASPQYDDGMPSLLLIVVGKD